MSVLSGLRVQSFSDGPHLRGKAVRLLSKDERISTQFIIRDGFFGTDGTDKVRAREEYIHNIVSADYAIVTRGAENLSYRLYEVLSCGRVPVFIDTDCVLPYDHIVDWRQYMVWVDRNDIASIADRIVEFHNSMTSERFMQLQRSIRRLYEEWISPVGFFRNLWRCLGAPGTT